MKRLLFILLISISGNIFAQSEPQNLLDSFFKTYEKDAGKAVKDLYATNKWTERVKDDIEKIVATVNGFTESYMGKYNGYEIITTKKFSESFILYSYLVKYDRQPIRFIFKFYKPSDKWVLYSYALDDTLDDEFKKQPNFFIWIWIKNNYLQQPLQRIWALGLMERWFCVWDDLANPKIGLKLIPNPL